MSSRLALHSSNAIYSYSMTCTTLFIDLKYFHKMCLWVEFCEQQEHLIERWRQTDKLDRRIKNIYLFNDFLTFVCKFKIQHWNDTDLNRFDLMCGAKRNFDFEAKPIHALNVEKTPTGDGNYSKSPFKYNSNVSEKKKETAGISMGPFRQYLRSWTWSS